MPINKVTDKSGKPVKKDGKQKYRVRVNYTDSYGHNKQIERTAYGADEAKQLERELTHSVKEETPTKKMTFGQLYDEYMEVTKHEVKENTYNTKAFRIEKYVLPTFGNTRLDRINLSALQKWKQNLNDTDLKTGYKKSIFKSFSAVFNYAVKMEYISHNPLERIGTFKAPLEEHTAFDYYTAEEFLLYITEARKYAEENDLLVRWNIYVFFCIAFYTGMRRGEMLALNWSDIKDGEINISKSYNEKVDIKITSPKNKSSIRTIQIPKPLQIVLDEHYNRCKDMPQFTDEYYICGGIKPIFLETIRASNNRFAQRAGIKRIRIHDFRHSHASLLVNNGINIQEIARRLGHADVGVTLRTYSHLYPKESERALAVLNEIKMS